MPPAETCFDPANRLSTIIPAHRQNRSPSSSVSASSGSSDLAHVSSILTTLIMAMGGRTLPERPKTPTQLHVQPSTSSPPVFSPSKITHYLEHAEQNLGVCNATTFEGELLAKSYGSDILHLIETQDLIAIGIPAGDAVRLKNGAQEWWSGPKARSLKRKALIEQPASGPAIEQPDPKKYRFEKHWDEDGGSGGASYFGSAIMQEDPDAEPRDYSWWFFCPLTQQMQPLPNCHVPQLAPE
jgi:hypothetical protein